MANRKRLTKDGFSRRAYDVENADPNSLNRVRNVPDAEQYMTWDPEANENHERPTTELPHDADLRHPTLNIAMPGSRQANLALLRTAQTLAKKSSLAIKVASALFPDGTEEFIEKQATDLMDLPLRSLVDTVARINKYAAEEAEMEAMDEDADQQEEADAGEAEAVEADAEAPMMMEPEAAPAPAPAAESWQSGGEAGEAPVRYPGVPEAALLPEEMGDVAPMDLGSPDEGGDLELDLEAAGEEGEEGEDEDLFGAAMGADKEVSNVNVDGADEMKMEAAIKASHSKTASRNTTDEKRGVKKIASAPRSVLGSNLDVENLSRLWKSDPDVSDHFNY